MKAGAAPAYVAEFVLRTLGVVTPPVDVHEIAARLGVQVRNVPSPGWLGAVDPTAEPAMIWINDASARVRKRFTLAHELGHLLLHPLTSRHRDASFARPADKIEKDANEFAASMLAPLWMLEPMLSNPRTTKEQLARMFDISDGAMAMQLSKFL